MVRSVLLVSILALMLAAPALAAPVTTDQGSKAVLFTFTGLSDMRVGTFGGGVGFRYYVQNDLALRPAVDFNLSSIKDESQNANLTDHKTTDTDMGLSLAIEKHHSGPASSVSPYMGVGAGFRVMHEKNEPSRAANNIPVGTVLKVTDSGMSVSGFLLGGFEWGFADGMTLGGEYQVGLSFGSSETKQDTQGQNNVTTTQTTSKMKGLGVGFSTASLFVSVGW
jgi:hypothetical protein